MSRMDRHKQVAEPQVNQENNSQPKPKKQPSFFKKRDKKRKQGRGGCLKIVGIFVLAIILLSAVGYGIGFFKAKQDKNNFSIEVNEFNGQKAHDGSTNILLLGSDSRGEDQGRSDSIMIAHYSKRDKQPKIVSIMRDTFVGIPTQDGLEYNKINAAYSYGGPELVRKTIQQNFDIPIQYYAIVNFDSFPKIIDTISPKGLKINAEKDLEVEGVNIAKGPNRLSGLETLQYARFRKDEEGDFGRVRRQQQVMTALTKQALNPLNSWRIPETLGAIDGYTDSNVPFSFYTKTGLSYTFSFHKPLSILTIPVEGSWQDAYYDHAGSVLEIDEAANKQAIQQFFSK